MHQSTKMKTAEGLFAPLLFLFLAIYIPTQKYQADLARILHGLLKEEDFPSRNYQNKVAIGFGSCIDVVTDGVQLLERVGIAPPETPLHNSVISSQEELAETFAFFFERGSASE